MEVKMNNIFWNFITQIDWIEDMRKRPMHYVDKQINGYTKEIESCKQNILWMEKEKSRWIRRRERIKTKGVNAIDMLLPKYLQKSDKQVEVKENEV
ncbi:hypothetical protein CMI37_39295 [Candidatus Pacearchaeota archaeon]|nr:hypothetical protein [Candidatus Pacearchaeota archaeon]|tara:strand:+ start:10262 stop:10549 length:288 start_codon:yes stop_codon:yes gene_type:complete